MIRMGRVEETLTPRDPMDATLSHLSILRFPAQTTGRLLFPGASRVPEGTAGYVRSQARAARALSARQPGVVPRLPFRDYGPEVLSHEDALLSGSAGERGLVRISARNVLNEWGCQVRLAGRWIRRAHDEPIDPGWPALGVGPGPLRMERLGALEADPSLDLLTGVPLVRAGQPSGRAFLAWACSDLAHSFEVHPSGAIGPPPPAWQALSESWQEGRDRGLPPGALLARLDAVALEHGARPSQNLLHSVVGRRDDGGWVIAGVTGALEDIARYLVSRHRVRDAIVLDNGGSVAWAWLAQGAATAQVLLAGANHRPKGTAFLMLNAPGFLQPAAHRALADEGEREDEHD